MIVFPLLKWFDVALKRGATIISTLTMEGFFMFFQQNKCISSIKQIKLSLKSSQKRRDDHFYSYYGRFFHVFSKINARHQKNKLSHPEILSKGSIFIKIYVKWSFSFRGGRGGQVRAWWLPEFVAPMLSSVSAPCLALPGFIIASSFREGRGNDEPIRAAIDSWNKKTTKSTLSRWDARSFFKSQVTFECRISTFSRRYPLDPLKTWRKCQDETLKIRKEEKRGGLA